VLQTPLKHAASGSITPLASAMKFEREIACRTFEHSGLVAVSRFLLNEQVCQTWQP
jgi:hypothetical protein